MVKLPIPRSMGYIKKPSQEMRILKLLKERGKSGVKAYELAMPRNQGGQGILQYNARIWSLRQKGYNIENKEPGHFVLNVFEENGQWRLV